jgi:hypothetical protein
MAPRGRFISRQISDSRDFNLTLSCDLHRLLWLMLIPHLDVEGRFWADPKMVKAKVVPRLDHISTDDVEAALEEFDSVGLIDIYHDEAAELVLQAPSFPEHQKGLRKDREQPSIFGAPPEELRSSSGVAPPQVQVQDQGQEQGQAASIRPTAAAAAGDAAAAAVLAELQRCGVSQPKRDKLARDPWITPERIRACEHEVSQRSTHNPVGLLVTMLENHDEPPRPPPDLSTLEGRKAAYITPGVRH